MTRGEALKDIYIKSILPAVWQCCVLHCQIRLYKRRDGRLCVLWLLCGLPFGIHQVLLWLTSGSSFFSIAICSCKKLGIDHLANPHKDYLIYNRF